MNFVFIFVCFPTVIRLRIFPKAVTLFPEKFVGDVTYINLQG